MSENKKISEPIKRAKSGEFLHIQYSDQYPDAPATRLRELLTRLRLQNNGKPLRPLSGPRLKAAIIQLGFDQLLARGNLGLPTPVAERRVYSEAMPKIFTPAERSIYIESKQRRKPGETKASSKGEDVEEVKSADIGSEGLDIGYEMLLALYQAKPRDPSIPLRSYGLNDLYHKMFDHLNVVFESSDWLEVRMPGKRPWQQDISLLRKNILEWIPLLLNRQVTAGFGYALGKRRLLLHQLITAKLLEPDFGDAHDIEIGTTRDADAVRHDFADLADYCWALRGVRILEEAVDPLEDAQFETLLKGV